MANSSLGHGAAIVTPPGHRSAADGVRAFVEGARLLGRHPTWWRYVVGPAVVTAGGLVLAVLGTFELHGPLTLRLLHLVGWSPGAISLGIARALVFLGTLVALATAAWVAGRIAAGPFLDLLSHQVEREACGRAAQPPPTAAEIAADVWLGLTHSVVVLLLYVSLACPLTLLQIVPVVGQLIATPLALGLAAMYLAREAWDYPMSRRRWGLGRKLAALRDHAAPALGLGSAGLVMLAIPGFNLLTMPVLTVAATRLFVALEDEGRMGGGARAQAQREA